MKVTLYKKGQLIGSFKDIDEAFTEARYLYVMEHGQLAPDETLPSAPGYLAFVGVEDEVQS